MGPSSARASTSPRRVEMAGRPGVGWATSGSTGRPISPADPAAVGLGSDRSAREPARATEGDRAGRSPCRTHLRGGSARAQGSGDGRCTGARSTGRGSSPVPVWSVGPCDRRRASPGPGSPSRPATGRDARRDPARTRRAERGGLGVRCRRRCDPTACNGSQQPQWPLGFEGAKSAGAHGRRRGLSRAWGSSSVGPASSGRARAVRIRDALGTPTPRRGDAALQVAQLVKPSAAAMLLTWSERLLSALT